MSIHDRAFWPVLALVCFLCPGLLHASTCTPGFPLEKGKTLGWEGADAAYSIPLRDGRDVGILGDPLYGPPREVAGQAPRQVHNSLGISTCDASGNWHLKYVIKHDASGSEEHTSELQSREYL